MTAQAPIYQRMGIARLQQIAATEGEHQDEAARAYVDRLCDMELERRLVMRHNRPGWHPSSPGFGDGTGRSTVAREPLAEEYDRGSIIHSPWHDRAKRAIGGLPQRQAAALMLQTAKTDPQTSGPFGASYDQMAASLTHFVHMLGFEGSVSAGRSFQCIEDQPRDTPENPPHERVTVPRDERERRILAERYEEAEQGPRTRRVRTAHHVAAFKNGQAIKWAARQARAALLMQAKVGAL